MASRTRFVAGSSATGSEPLASSLAEPGDRIGRFEIERVLGQGGMGVVYAALDPRLRREVALKVLRGGSADRGHHARVTREARALARLSHPNVVPIFDVGLDRGTLWVAMELVHGPTLSAWLATGPAWPRVVQAFQQAGRGLAAAHAAGLVHRDFKPGNAMLAPDGRVVVLDFGLAWAPGVEGGRADTTASSSSCDAAPRHHALSARDPLAYTLTDAGTVVGTLPYMAPEQHAHHDVDARADQYALCISLYEGLAGRRPFGGQPAAMIAAKRAGPPVLPESTAVPARLWKAIARGLQPDPQRRFADVPQLLEALERAVHPRVRPARWIASLGVTGLVAAMWPRPSEAPCLDEARIDAMWNDARRAAISIAFATHGAHDTWTTAEARLQDRLAEYRELARSSCTARIEPRSTTADDTEACLDRSLRATAVALDLLSTPDRAMIAAAPRLVSGLPRVRDCDTQTSTPPLRDPALRDQLERARALQQVGRGKEAVALAEESLQRARMRDDAAGIAASRLLLGGCQMELGAWDDAAASLENAHHEAVAAGDDRVATTAAIKLAHLAAYRLQPDAGETWLREAQSSLVRLGEGGGMERAQLELARGDLQATGGRFEDALASYEAALEGAIAHGGEDQLVVSVILTAIGSGHARAGRPNEALAVYERALAIEERLVGLRDAGRTSIREMMAAAYYELGRTEEALGAFRSVLAAHEAAEGPHHPGVVRLRGNLVLLLLDAGRLHEAAAESEDVLALKRRIFGPEDMQVGIALNNQGLVLTRLGRLPEALAAYREALRLYELALGPDHPDLAYPLGGIADLSLQLQHPADALAAVERAMALRETHGPPADPDLWFLLARARWEMGDPSRAIEAARAAERGLAAAASTRPSKLDPGELKGWLREHGIEPA